MPRKALVHAGSPSLPEEERRSTFDDLPGIAKHLADGVSHGHRHPGLRRRQGQAPVEIEAKGLDEASRMLGIVAHVATAERPVGSLAGNGGVGEESDRTADMLCGPLDIAGPDRCSRVPARDESLGVPNRGGLLVIQKDRRQPTAGRQRVIQSRQDIPSSGGGAGEARPRDELVVKQQRHNLGLLRRPRLLFQRRQAVGRSGEQVTCPEVAADLVHGCHGARERW